jgi:hypothetical protein
MPTAWWKSNKKRRPVYLMGNEVNAQFKNVAWASFRESLIRNLNPARQWIAVELAARP